MDCVENRVALPIFCRLQPSKGSCRPPGWYFLSDGVDCGPYETQEAATQAWRRYEDLWD